jgi:hypothetical protein
VALIELTDGWVPDDYWNPTVPFIAPYFFDLSEQALASGCTDAWGDCTGGNKNDALDAIRDNGIVDESCLLYTSGSCLDDDNDCVSDCGSAGDCANPNTCPDVCGDGGAPWGERLWSIENHDYYDERNDVPGVKITLLRRGPLVTCSKDWGHCVTIVGWDDDSELCRNHYDEDGCWIIKNSWGVDVDPPEAEHDNGDRYDDSWWQLNGFAYIPFENHDYSGQVRRNIHYLWGVVPPAGWSWP